MGNVFLRTCSLEDQLSFLPFSIEDVSLTLKRKHELSAIAELLC